MREKVANVYYCYHELYVHVHVCTFRGLGHKKIILTKQERERSEREKWQMYTTVIMNCMYMYVGTFSGLGHKKKKFLNR